MKTKLRLENPRSGIEKSILAKKPIRSKIGTRGFLPSDNPKEKILNIRVTAETKDFIEAWCSLWGITQTELLLRSIEYYTGFDGNNAADLINQCHK